MLMTCLEHLQHQAGHKADAVLAIHRNPGMALGWQVWQQAAQQLLHERGTQGWEMLKRSHQEPCQHSAACQLMHTVPATGMLLSCASCWRCTYSSWSHPGAVPLMWPDKCFDISCPVQVPSA